jgi:hypothetical protein
MVREGKLDDIDVMIDVTKNNIRRRQEWLAGLHAEAGNLERTGKPVPQHLSDNIAQTERAIQDAYATILDREAQKESIRASFARDLKRFQQLKNLPETEVPIPAERARPVLHNIVTCSGPDECDRLWVKATAYARKHATTAVQASGDNVLITSLPSSEQDVSLILSRIEDKDGPGSSLFLDLQCERSPRGSKTCKSPQAQQIIEGFRPAVVGGDTSEP